MFQMMFHRSYEIIHESFIKQSASEKQLFSSTNLVIGTYVGSLKNLILTFNTYGTKNLKSAYTVTEKL